MMEALKESSLLMSTSIMHSCYKYFKIFMMVLSWPKNHSTHKPLQNLNHHVHYQKSLEYYHHEDERNNSDLKCIMF